VSSKTLVRESPEQERLEDSFGRDDDLRVGLAQTCHISRLPTELLRGVFSARGYRLRQGIRCARVALWSETISAKDTTR